MSLPAVTSLVTGSSRGIGAAIADDMAARGATIIRHASSTALPGCLSYDLSDPSQTTLLWEKALDQAGGNIDVLVNNAGIFEASPITMDEADWLDGWERTMQINLSATAQLCRLAVRHWQESGRAGRIVNVASRAGHRGDSPDHWHYAASKGGMLALTKTIARGYAAQNILAFAVCPGFTVTGMVEEYLASRGGDKLLADIPLGRVATPDEIAAIVSFCALDAPASMTGAVIDANGASYVR